MRLLIATDAWAPQINGVVQTLSGLSAELTARGVEVRILSPQDFTTVPCPTYPEIRLALAGKERAARALRTFGPDHIHIATEGPIGLRMRRAALEANRSFTTSFHTRFPEYLRRRAPIPKRMTYAYLRWFHAPARACLVPSSVIRAELAQRGFSNLVTWTRGVDTGMFRPSAPIDLDLPRPIFATVSRIAPEKNLEAFLDLDLPGSKLVVGDGPTLPELRRRYPGVHFAGLQRGEALTRHYSTADVFVFASKSDTFGLVLLEAMACGVPIAAFPEPGPLDAIGQSGAGCLDHDLRIAALAALSIAPETALKRAAEFSWAACADVFLDVVTEKTRHADVSANLPVAA